MTSIINFIKAHGVKASVVGNKVKVTDIVWNSLTGNDEVEVNLISTMREARVLMGY